MAPSPPTGRRTASASSEPRRRKSTGGRLLRHDRRLGRRFVAGADEAGRGCLAGPLVAAAVLFDLERLDAARRPRAAALNDSKQHDPEAREELYPVVLRVAAKVAVVSRCVRGIDTRGLHRTNLAALRDALLRGRAARARSACPTASRSATSTATRGARSSTATPRARRSPPPRSSPRSRATGSCAAPTRAIPAGSSRRTSATPRPSTARRSSRIGVSPLHRLSFQSTAYQQLALVDA